MLDLHAVGEPVDALTLVEHLKQAGQLERGRRPRRGRPPRGLGPRGRQRAPVRAHRPRERDAAPPPAGLLRDPGPRPLPRGAAARARRLAERAILEVAHEDRRKDFRAIHDLLDAELDKLEQLSREGTRRSPARRPGFEDLDTITGGFQPGNLIILAARPSMGKSCADGQLRRERRARPSRPVALFSLEMSEARARAALHRLPGVDQGRRPAQGQGAADALGEDPAASNRLAESPLFVDDSSDLSVLDVRAKARRLAQQQADGLGLILIDYLQLMRATGRPTTARSRSGRSRAGSRRSRASSRSR